MPAKHLNGAVTSENSFDTPTFMAARNVRIFCRPS